MADNHHDSKDDLANNYQGVWGTRIGFGQRPALLAVDFLQAYTRPGAPLYAPGVVEAMDHAPRLLQARGTAVFRSYIPTSVTMAKASWTAASG